MLWGVSSDQISLFLRQRKDELEQRMSALQESRRELMVQLEGLMKLLKVRSSTWYHHREQAEWSKRGEGGDMTTEFYRTWLFPPIRFVSFPFYFLPWSFNSGSFKWCLDDVVPVVLLHHHCHLLLSGWNIRDRLQTIEELIQSFK